MLTCHILNNIQATRTWRKNGVVQSETGEVLTITPPTDTDDTYTCTVMNDCGTDTASTTVFSKRTRGRERGRREGKGCMILIYCIINM